MTRTELEKAYLHFMDIGQGRSTHEVLDFWISKGVTVELEKIKSYTARMDVLQSPVTISLIAHMADGSEQEIEYHPVSECGKWHRRWVKLYNWLTSSNRPKKVEWIDFVKIMDEIKEE